MGETIEGGQQAAASPDTPVHIGGTARPKLVYLAGAQHSGSTILEAILTSCQGVRGIGQFGRFYAFNQYDDCDCGRPSASCEPCVAVKSGIDGDVGMTRYRLLGKLTRREWGLPLFLLVPPVRRRYAARSDHALTTLVAHTGATVILDSSKSISRAIAMLDSTEFDVRIVFCVRNPDGFVSSRQKRTGRAGRAWTVLRTWKWLAKNLMVERLLLPRTDDRLTIKFEELAQDPAGVIGRLAVELDIDGSEAEARLRDGVEFERTHLFEPPRQLDYGKVTFDPGRSSTSRARDIEGRDLAWALGGRYGKRYGYHR
jgi:hypothetical protein